MSSSRRSFILRFLSGMAGVAGIRLLAFGPRVSAGTEGEAEYDDPKKVMHHLI